MFCVSTVLSLLSGAGLALPGLALLQLNLRSVLCMWGCRNKLRNVEHGAKPSSPVPGCGAEPVTSEGRHTIHPGLSHTIQE